MKPTRKIDHIVYAVPDLNNAMDELETQLGIRPVFGGFHKTQGTKNALLNLGKGCYLEILALDNQNTEIITPRWMGIDLITEPRITRWAIKSENIAIDSKSLKSLDNNMGEIYEGSRKMTSKKTLSWKMTLPLASPKIELIPFMVDWSDSTFHPTEKLQKGCNLKEINLESFNSDKDNQALNELGIKPIVTKSDNNKISISIEGLHGIVILH